MTTRMVNEVNSVREFFSKENSHKVYSCLVGNEYVLLQCYYDIDYDKVEAYNWNNPEDAYNYIDKIDEVFGEHIFDDEDDIDRNITEEDLNFRDSLLVQEDVYEYRSNQDLTKLLLIFGVDVVNGDKESTQGLVFCYSEYDDFSCYGDGFTHYAKIINNANINNTNIDNTTNTGE